MELVLAAIRDTAPGHVEALVEVRRQWDSGERDAEQTLQHLGRRDLDPDVTESMRQVTAAQVLIWELWTLQRAEVAPADLFASRESISRVRAVVLADLDTAEHDDSRFRFGELVWATAAALFGTNERAHQTLMRAIDPVQPLFAECRDVVEALTGPWSVQEALAPTSVGKRYYLTAPFDRLFDLPAALGRPGHTIDLSRAVEQATQQINDRVREATATQDTGVEHEPLDEQEREEALDHVQGLRYGERTLFGDAVMRQVATDDQWRIDGRGVGDDLVAPLLMQRAISAADGGLSASAIMMFPHGDLIDQSTTWRGMPVRFTSDFARGYAVPPDPDAAEFPVAAVQQSPDGTVRWWGIEHDDLTEGRYWRTELRRRLERMDADPVAMAAEWQVAIAEGVARLSLTSLAEREQAPRVDLADLRAGAAAQVSDPMTEQDVDALLRNTPTQSNVEVAQHPRTAVTEEFTENTQVYQGVHTAIPRASTVDRPAAAVTPLSPPGHARRPGPPAPAVDGAARPTARHASTRGPASRGGDYT